MLTHPQVQRYSVEAGLRNIMIAENEIVLTYLLQLMAERGILDKLAFKGGTCLRKMFIGSGGRFSTDLDFTRVEEHDHEEVILVMMEAFDHPFHGIQFSVPDDSYYETQDGLSWGVNPVYAHDWNPSGQSEIKLQVSRREVPTLPPPQNSQCTQSYFRHLPFQPADIICLDPARDRRREAPGLLPTQQGTRHLRPQRVCDSTSGPTAYPPARRPQALAGGRCIRPGSSLGEVRRCQRLRLGRSPAAGPENTDDRTEPVSWPLA